MNKKEKIWQISRKVKLKFFRYTVTVVFTENVLASRYALNDEFGSMFDEECMALFCAKNDFEGYIFLPLDADIELITHESFHAITAIMRSMGAYLDDSSEECYAYALGYLCRKIGKFQKKALTKCP